MAKVTGTIRINANPGSSATVGHFEVVFVPYAGRLNTKPVRDAIWTNWLPCS